MGGGGTDCHAPSIPRQVEKDKGKKKLLCPVKTLGLAIETWSTSRRQNYESHP